MILSTQHLWFFFVCVYTYVFFTLKCKPGIELLFKEESVTENQLVNNNNGNNYWLLNVVNISLGSISASPYLRLII